MKLILQIALGVTLGVVLGGALLHLYTGALAEQVSTALAEKLSAKSVPKISTDAIENPPVNIPPVLSNLPSQADASNHPITEIGLPHEVFPAQESDLYAKEQKEKLAAFNLFYKRPEKCYDHHENHDVLIACGNEYIRARKKFEEQWLRDHPSVEIPVETPDEEKAKAEAFKTFYKKSEQCLSANTNHDTLVTCGNEYIRNKKQFEELWQQGKFKK
jgi:hypothetical protein